MPDLQESQEDALTRLTKIRGSLKSRLTVIKTFVNGIDSSLPITVETLHGLEARLAKLSELYDSFIGLQLDIDMLFVDIPVAQTHERVAFDNSYFLLDSQIRKLLSQNQSSLAADSARNSNNIGAQIKLPEIKLPIFDGKLANWLEFRDLYESLVHNKSNINNIEKFHYLRSVLSGEASLIVSSLEFSNSAYIEAWRLLCNRYNNTKILVHSHVRAIFSFDSIPKESAPQIRHILDNLAKHLAALRLLKEPVEHWDTLVIHIVTSKLDAHTSREWEEYQLSRTEPVNLATLTTFLENKARVLDSLQVKRLDKAPNVNTTNQRYRNSYASGQSAGRVLATSYHSNNCVVCKQIHSISQCGSFLRLSVNERVNLAKTLKLCLNCLRTNHFVSSCKSSHCQKCGRKHHTLLHFESRAPQVDAPLPNAQIQASAEEVPGIITATTATTTAGNCPALLATAVVYAYDNQGKRHNLRALLDSGSQSSFVTSSAIKRLGVACTRVNVPVHGFNQSVSYLNNLCEFSIYATQSNFVFNGKFFVAPTITSSVPATSFEFRSLKLPPGVYLADPEFNVSREVDLLLGADCFWDILLPGQCDLGPNMPVARNTKLGWVVAGPLSFGSSRPIFCNVARLSLDEQIANFWKIEEVPDSAHHTVEDEKCERHFLATTRRTDAGRFIVNIPVYGLDQLGNSFEIARKRFWNLERKLQQDKTLQRHYVDFINEYIELGHMQKVATKSLDISPHYYLPHHAVFNFNSSTTKVRVVFDASSQTSTGISFNQCQHVGPVLQNDIFSILLRFRKYAFVVTADLSKMYRQILVDKSQHALQRILWRESPEHKLETYELQTVTYGTASGAYLAIRCLQQLADENASAQPEVARVIKNDFYMDDVLTGADDAEELLAICRSLDIVLASGCFKLHKWRSNTPNIINAFDSVTQSQPLAFEGNNTAKTLGLMWNTNHDQLAFNVNSSNMPTNYTKRILLSELAQIFDPLGLVAPCLIVGKIIMQKLWLEKVTWDDVLPPHIINEWISYRTNLMHINNFSINRYAFAAPNCNELQLHGFCDASTAAYGACIYARIMSQHGVVSCQLLCSKTRVAPLKTVSIPRLELCGAVLLVRLTKLVLSVLEVNFSKIFLWTDSSIVLAWLKTPPVKLNTFVSNRVAEIQDFSDVHSWRHVPTKTNPADMLSRGVRASVLENCLLWWSGPQWLTDAEHDWPNLTISHSDKELPEQRKLFIQSCVNTQPTELISWKRFSSFDKLCRVVAYVRHFIVCCKSRLYKTPPEFTKALALPNLRVSEHLIIKLIQKQEFSSDLKTLRSNKQLHMTSPLIRLSPFIDTNGLIRVGGRLEHSNLPDQQIHQAILPKHYVTNLLFLRDHRRLLHVAPLGLLNSMRQRYWPLSGRSIARQIVFRCTVCFRANPKPYDVPLMGQLPNARASPSSPFTHCGIDYAGPLELRANHLRNSKTFKGYVALFVCMCTKAVHLELLTSLTTDAFLSMFKRFYSRRGLPSHVYSDNATNFVGANRELQNFFKQHSTDIVSDCASMQIFWHFIPPRSPHFGGLWEAGVKSTKYHLKRVIGTRTLTYENFATLLAQVEAILNSRPISPLTVDPNDVTPLTPGHFMIGRPLTALPEDVAHIADNRLSHFQQIQAMTDAFWKRWVKDYINTVQQRTKWTRKGKAVPKVGQLVIIKDDNAPVLQWTTGRITQLHTGQDNITRVVTVRTRSGEFKRTIAKLCPLPIDSHETKEDEDKGEA